MRGGMEEVSGGEMEGVSLGGERCSCGPSLKEGFAEGERRVEGEEGKVAGLAVWDGDCWRDEVEDTEREEETRTGSWVKVESEVNVVVERSEGVA